MVFNIVYKMLIDGTVFAEIFAISKVGVYYVHVNCVATN